MTSMDSFAARHGQVLVWIIVMLVSVGLAYGELRSQQAALSNEVTHVKTEQQDRDKIIEERLDRIQRQLQSIEEFLRENPPRRK